MLCFGRICNKNHDRQLWKMGMFPPGLITFWKRVHALEQSCQVLGSVTTQMCAKKILKVQQ
ncbi:putative polygalacturonate 4-alpha-galacturonosyltransferase [Helianthus annuus]|nr:putative polygalacturonate 4-alpha-galacturonosyltransferase [Helianthus annuus]